MTQPRQLSNAGSPVLELQPRVAERTRLWLQQAEAAERQQLLYAAANPTHTGIQQHSPVQRSTALTRIVAPAA